MDKKIVIPAVVPASEFRQLLEDHLLREQQKWFKSLRGPGDYDVSDYGEQDEYHPGHQSDLWNKDSSRTYDCWRADLILRSLRSPTADEPWIVKGLRRWLEPSKGAFFKVAGQSEEWRVVSLPR